MSCPDCGHDMSESDDALEMENARLRDENERLLAVKNGPWRARYSDASREVEQLREALTVIRDLHQGDCTDVFQEIARQALRPPSMPDTTAGRTERR